MPLLTPSPSISEGGFQFFRKIVTPFEPPLPPSIFLGFFLKYKIQEGVLKEDTPIFDFNDFPFWILKKACYWKLKMPKKLTMKWRQKWEY